MGVKVCTAFQRNDNKRVYLIKDSKVYRYGMENARTLDEGFPKSVNEMWPGMPFAKVDAAFKAKHAGKLYFFSGDQYLRYDISAEKVDDGYPKKIKDEWNGLPFVRIDAACQRCKVFIELDNEVFEKVVFFKDDEFAVYDLDSDKMANGYPKKIKERFNIPFDSIDAIFQDMDHPVFYIFKGDEYLVYDFQARKVFDSYPKKLEGSWADAF